MFLNLPSSILWTIAGLYSLLVVGSGIIFTRAWLQPQRDWGELQNRIKSWWVIVTMFALAIASNRMVSLVCFSLVSFLALKEYLSLIPTRKVDRRVLLWAYLALLLQYYWIHIGWYGMFLIFIPIYAFLFLVTRLVLAGETSGFLQAASTLHWGLILTVYTLSHLAYLRMLPTAGNPGGVGLLVFLVILTEINDIAQYIFGKWLGQHPALPRVSPGKTVEGLLGGVVTTTGLAIALAPYLTPFDFPHALGIGLLIGLSGFLGDVTVSALKRDLGIKDSGTLIPGHGGVLDRLDSLTFTAPIFFHYTVYFCYSGQLL
jgi:phosphatidate cytidylyltransferase